MIRISLIITTYNRAAELVRALESVAEQDLPAAEWECLVVNNNSADDTRARFEAFVRSHPGTAFRMVDEPRQGLSHARNRGVAESAAPIFVFVDDDQTVVRGFLSSYAAFFDAHPDAYAAGGPIVAEYPCGRPAWMSRYTERPIANPMDFGPQVRPFPQGRIPGGGNMAFRRGIVEEGAPLFDPLLGRRGDGSIGGEECDLFERLQRRGLRIWYVPGAGIRHIIPPEKLTEHHLRRLYRGVGATQYIRARESGRLGRARLIRFLKDKALWLLAYFMRSKAQRDGLLLLREEIARGFSSARTAEAAKPDRPQTPAGR